jgi:hypothetical protein
MRYGSSKQYFLCNYKLWVNFNFLISLLLLLQTSGYFTYLQQYWHGKQTPPSGEMVFCWQLITKCPQDVGLILTFWSLAEEDVSTDWLYVQSHKGDFCTSSAEATMCTAGIYRKGLGRKWLGFQCYDKVGALIVQGTVRESCLSDPLWGWWELHIKILSGKLFVLQLNPLMPELNSSTQRCLTRFLRGNFASWTVHFVNICVKNRQIQQLFIQFINYIWYLLHVSALHCHLQGAFLVSSERYSIEAQSIEYCGWAWCV